MDPGDRGGVAGEGRGEGVAAWDPIRCGAHLGSADQTAPCIHDI